MDRGYPHPPPSYQQQSQTATGTNNVKSQEDTNKEIRLYKNAKDRRRFEDMADLYAVIKTTQHLEKAYIRDAVSADDYTEACSRLISQFKTNEKAIDIDTLDFINEYKMDCPLAVERLLTAGVPATVMHATGRASKDKTAAVIAAEATQEFITAMDVLRLDQRAVDEVQPVISSLLNSLHKTGKCMYIS
mmetsp:Transcript_30035/g.36983  ORF Transcript_30035/g.36983 Transcript_30035/m.36983 type:complete len:189 (+) Transcript_30035:641-1207(+)